MICFHIEDSWFIYFVHKKKIKHSLLRIVKVYWIQPQIQYCEKRKRDKPTDKYTTYKLISYNYKIPINNMIKPKWLAKLTSKSLISL